jgi:hypothetical protein
MPDENLADYKVEHPVCGHLQTIKARAHQNLADYNSRLVPELREKLNTIKCEQCEQQKAELAKQKLVQDMKAKSK